MRLEEDIKETINMINTDSIIEKYDEMIEYSRIYQNTTENIRAYMPFLDGNYQKALLPTASGDHQLEAILRGINDITCFDINRLAKYFTELKFGAIKNLSKKEYMNFMYENVLNIDVFNYLKNSLADDVLVFWEEILKNCSSELICKNFFRFLGLNNNNDVIKGIDCSKYCALKFTSYLEDNNYKIVQDRLEKVKIKYIDADLINLTQELREKYDLINLTNIYEYVNSDMFKSGDKLYSDIVFQLIAFLNENGKILITYLYRCSLNDIKKYGKKSITYAKLLCMLENVDRIRIWYDQKASQKGRETIMDKLYSFRNVQFLRYLKDIEIEYQKIEGTGFSSDGLADSDLVCIYNKK